MTPLLIAQDIYEALRQAQPGHNRRPWAKLDHNQQEIYLIIAEHITNHYEPRNNIQPMPEVSLHPLA